MKAVLNIYADCSSEQPTKQYVAYRLLVGVNQKIQSYTNALLKQENQSEEKQTEYTLKIIKAIFPTFQDEELYYIDQGEWLEFTRAISNENKRINEDALKN